LEGALKAGIDVDLLKWRMSKRVWWEGGCPPREFGMFTVKNLEKEA